jgi:hypothetical protein
VENDSRFRIKYDGRDFSSSQSCVNIRSRLRVISFYTRSCIQSSFLVYYTKFILSRLCFILSYGNK